ncbi:MULTISPECIES: Na+/H+ antiporter subunit A [unclassified Paenibacillus]|uniref:Na+/H+ antiporter subunit A n=1 Tax=unclassified Paenibacillus TaxID=185978 RepID=UPI002404AD25|nr:MULTISPECIES: Na+/H+ antiporter subunit A [unclassified Paenibacillus]MDF9839443.1 multicomponent Na+:H+ antiporter subunit A [Paenibacillus sp. PastF-2]MDF9846023.1 multicomponent Na+:H+ antiporter subunit A [Paenibacillus sp. PastM-2]MDF9852596.1 multicomponent Na+:H+ antiporter subunit A [Paenibacillus sp. PastF-1]MDH6477673.1 multicomponent Na+:H+ antiporter subunit A [Paenibacillus sp. PastH-2]MDH6505413.1 multicomponent Na+:H+ antiporter subunit A [Paenibacillus sp. PastM-3]
MLHIVILLPFLLSVLMLLIRQTTRFHPGWIVLPLPVVLFLYFLLKITAVRAGEPIINTIAWMPSFGVDITLILDGLSLIFVLLITGMGALVVLYSIYYLDKQTEGIRRFYVYLLMFMGAMLGVVLSDNLIILYGFWELTSISSFLLIAFWYGRERSGYGAVKSMLITVFGGLAMFAGFNLLYVMTGTYSIREIIGLAGTLTDNAMFIPAMLLILLGAFTKSAQFPFHIWLPDAMEAPTPVSAYLHSATMVKAGIYLVARLTPIFAGQSEWFWLVSVTGLLTLIYGSFKAIRQTDLKALLAYSTISQLGLIMSLLGFGSAAGFFAGKQDALFYTMATSAALFHLINHAVFKGSLFMVVGIIDHESGTRDLRKLGGLMSLMPVTFSVALMGAFSMAGLPPFSGFLSKEMFFTSVLNIREFDILNAGFWLQLFAVIAWLASVFTFVYSMILVFKTFGGKLQKEKLDKVPHEAPLGLLLSPVILVSLTLVLAFFPDLVAVTLIEPAMASIHTGLLAPEVAFEVSIHFWHGWTPEIFMTLGVIAAGLLLYKGYTRLRVLDRETRGRNTLNRVYDASLQLLEMGSRRITNAYMTGSNRHYLLYIFSFIIISLLAVLLREPGISFGMAQYADLSFYELAVIAVMLMAAFAVPFAKSRVNAILFTGGVGYMVTLLFVLFRAPDLALTQMIIETVSVILFLLCFRYLPKLKQQKERVSFKLPNLIIALGVGVTVTLVALAAMGSSPFEPISEFFLKESYNLAGGKNVVNVILVDFRGFDTLFEIMVLGIASLGIYGLINLRMEEDHMQQRQGDARLAVPLRSNDVILKTMSKGIIIIILVFSFYLFFAGHNHPGGGFIGALMTSAALVLMTIAFGMDQVRKAFPVNYRLLTAAGLLLAILTASGSFLFGAPFLSHAFGHFHLPILGDVELATAVLFDLGVYLAVVGVAMNIILTIGGDKRWNS